MPNLHVLTHDLWRTVNLTMTNDQFSPIAFSAAALSMIWSTIRHFMTASIMSHAKHYEQFYFFTRFEPMQVCCRAIQTLDESLDSPSSSPCTYYEPLDFWKSCFFATRVTSPSTAMGACGRAVNTVAFGWAEVTRRPSWRSQKHVLWFFEKLRARMASQTQHTWYPSLYRVWP